MGLIIPFTFRMIWFCYVLVLHLYSDIVAASALSDTITEGQSLNLSQTIVSSGQVFELGFFVPDGSDNIYVGIWYKVDRAAVVWVGNRDKPVTIPSANLTISQANLLIFGDGFSYLMSNVSTTRKTVAVLLDSGNLVLRDEDSTSDILWQSFDYPTDTLLPQMKLGTDKLTGRVWSLTTWKDSRDPSPGNFSLYLNPERPVEFVLMKGSRTYWSSGSFDGQIFPSVRETRLNSLNNYTFVNNESIAYFTYGIYNASVLARFLLEGTGTMNMMTWQDSDKEWNLIWSIPRDKCDLYSSCGPFSSCNSFSSVYCQCLEGFRPLDLASWLRQETSGGCVRKTPLLCDSNGTNTDKFSEVQNVILPLNPEMSSTISLAQCRANCLNDCFCNAYAYDGMIGCSLWKEDLLNIRLLAGDDPNGGRFYLRLAASELRDNQGTKRLIKIISAVSASVLLILLVIYIYLRGRIKQKGKKGADEGIPIFDAEVMSATAHPAIGKQRSTNWFPQFTLSSIVTATDNFSQKRKLGEGGFGSVYKGVLRNGQEVAVKRLSSKSSQGLQELRNETMLMFKLQHKNLVRILGCSLDKGEKILVYEYMPNGSLDSFLFDPIKRGSVGWVARAHIIKGISQGLLYLHEYSRLRIIHRDLKASNILLDKEMNPKISDFGLAKMFEGNISRAKTNHVAGTYGYMSPEYALGGVVSIKSDVFSFGVLLLEIISGKKNAGFYQTGSINLLSYAWELWHGEKALQLVDPALGQDFDSVVVMRYMKVGLLCVEEIAGDRPTMSEVVPMLTNENAALPSPKQPAFTNYRPARMPDQPICPPELCSKNDITVSAVVGR